MRHLVLDDCVDRRNMCNVYSGNAFQGCIWNVCQSRRRKQGGGRSGELAAVNTTQHNVGSYRSGCACDPELE